jgi:adenylate kinase
MGTLFMAGIYGVGKSTLGEALSRSKRIPFYSASDLISLVNGEEYGANKVVADKVGNQDILVAQVEHLLGQHDRILLAGHFCIVNKHGEVDPLPWDAFKKLHIDKIILLEAEEIQIMNHLHARDEKKYSPELVSTLMQTERKMAYTVSAELGCPIVTYCMTYTSADISTIEQVL